MGCMLGIPNDTKIHLDTQDELTLLVKGKDTIRLVPLRKSLDVVVIERKNSKGHIVKEPMLVQNV